MSRIAIVIMLSAVIYAAEQQTAFISGKGTDTETCGTMESPCLTIQYTTSRFKNVTNALQIQFADNTVLTQGLPVSLNASSLGMINHLEVVGPGQIFGEYQSGCFDIEDINGDTQVVFKDLTFNACYRDSQFVSAGVFASVSPYLSLTFEGCTFTEGRGALGGAMRLENTRNLTIIDSSFSQFDALYGGCLYLINVENVSVKNVEFQLNTASGKGVVLYLDTVPVVQMDNITMHNNTPSLEHVEGAIYAKNSTLMLTNIKSSFNGRQSAIGGFVYLLNSDLHLEDASLVKDEGHSRVACVDSSMEFINVNIEGPDDNAGTSFNCTNCQPDALCNITCPCSSCQDCGSGVCARQQTSDGDWCKCHLTEEPADCGVYGNCTMSQGNPICDCLDGYAGVPCLRRRLTAGFIALIAIAVTAAVLAMLGMALIFIFRVRRERKYGAIRIIQ